MRPLPITLTAALLLSLAACAQKSSQDVYKAGEVGVSQAVEFGTILNIREVEIAADNKGEGMIAGGAAGLGAGSYANGSNNAMAQIGGALIGAAIGNAIQENAFDSEGYEYTLEMLNGDIKTIAQEKIEGEHTFKVGDKVMLQYCDAGEHNKKCVSGKQYQRLLPVSKFPSKAAKTHKKKHSVEPPDEQ